MTIGNTFPQFNNFNEFVDDESKPLIQEANDETTELIGDLIDLRKVSLHHIMFPDFVSRH